VLSFEDASMDAIVSCDVLEHVAGADKALTELARVLRPDGVLVLTVPFASDRPETFLRARIAADGRIEHIAEPNISPSRNTMAIRSLARASWRITRWAGTPLIGCARRVSTTPVGAAAFGPARA
jgi:ubiquinone/menaquinone biosynthesis C-methylase UbiE